MSLICRSCMERGKTCPDTAAPVRISERESSKRLTPQGVEYRRGACRRTGS